MSVDKNHDWDKLSRPDPILVGEEAEGVGEDREDGGQQMKQ